MKLFLFSLSVFGHDNGDEKTYIQLLEAPSDVP